MLESMEQAGLDTQSIEREKEWLKLKRTHILKQHRDGYIDDTELQAEMAAVELALHGVDVPEMDGLRLDDIIEAGECLPSIAALWEVATLEERREMVRLLLNPGRLYYDLEIKEIVVLKPCPAFLPIIRLIDGLMEYQEATGTLVTSDCPQEENVTGRQRRPTGSFVMFLPYADMLSYQIVCLSHFFLAKHICIQHIH